MYDEEWARVPILITRPLAQVSGRQVGAVSSCLSHLSDTDFEPNDHCVIECSVLSLYLAQGRNIEMKLSILCVYVLTLFFSMQAWAMDSRSCSDQSAQLAPSERKAFLQSCLAQVSSPANVKEIELQRKKAVCEQNAKNYKLQGNDKANYVVTCINKNEAAAAVEATKKATTTDKAKSDREIEPQTSAKTTAHAKVHVDAKAQLKSKANSKSKVKPKAKPKAKSKSKSKAKPNKDASDTNAKSGGNR